MANARVAKVKAVLFSPSLMFLGLFRNQWRRDALVRAEICRQRVRFIRSALSFFFF